MPMRLFMSHMKTINSLAYGSRTARLTLFAGVFLLPLSLLFPQGTQPGAATDYTSVDITNTITAGPVINVKQITSSSTAASPARSGTASRTVRANIVVARICSSELMR